jgi:hypothetical protein
VICVQHRFHARSIFRRKIAFVVQKPRQRSCSSFAEAAPASRSCATLIVVGGEQALQLLWRGGGEVHGCECVPADLPDGELKKGQLLVYYCPDVSKWRPRYLMHVLIMALHSTSVWTSFSEAIFLFCLLR